MVYKDSKKKHISITSKYNLIDINKGELKTSEGYSIES